MKRIDPADYQRSLASMNRILTGMAQHAEVQARMRCPYKNRLDQCTAAFGCRNKRPTGEPGQLPACASDDRLDYRSAWESDPTAYETARAALGDRSRASGDGTEGTVSHEGSTCPVQVGRSIFDHADDLAAAVPSSCGRTGHCHECIVQVTEGMEFLSPPAESEAFLTGSYRLACQAVVRKAGNVRFSCLRRRPQILAAQRQADVDLAPMVQRRGQEVAYDGKIIDRYRGRICGLALDLGTTTVVAELVDLETGASIGVSSFENPQRFGGSDVMHRISYDGGPFQGELHQAIITTVNNEIRQMCESASISRQVIYELLVVGNTTMRDLFLGLDVQSIGQKPYKSTIEHAYRNQECDTTSANVAARKLGLYANRHARVFAAPLVASHVGGDVVAALLTIGALDRDELFMLVDAGTNTEVVIGDGQRFCAASCPAGPAFEGGLVRYGMPGCEGAIDSIRYVAGKSGSGGRFGYTTIGDVKPQGLCGSGLIDLLAELRRNDLMTPKGVFAGKARELSIVPEYGITFTRRDASELAQAKAANTCGQVMLMRQFGVRPGQIDRCYLAGGFANYVNLASAVAIGFIAPVPVERIVKVGNAAAEGARQMLLSARRRRDIERLIQRIEHVELETMPDFFDLFVEGCQIKPMPLS